MPEQGQRITIVWAGVMAPGLTCTFLDVDDLGWWVVEYPSNTSGIGAKTLRLHANPANLANWRPEMEA